MTILLPATISTSMISHQRLSTRPLAIRSKGPTASTESLYALTTQPTAAGDALLLTLQPPIGPSRDIHHVPCEIVLVIDVSGSMQIEPPPPDGGEETGLSILDLTKHAAKTIVALLGDNDKLGLITFSSSAKVVHPLTPMTKAARESVIKKIGALRHEGATNLWAGMREGLKQFKGPVGVPVCTRAMFVLTDGRPNHMCPAKGYIPALKPLLEQPVKYGHPPIQINTFGFGYDIRSGLLHSIAEAAGGTYGFIPDCGMIGTVFVHAMANLLATCAVGATVQLEVPAKCELTVAGALSHSIKQCGSKQHITIPMGSLQYGQPRDVVLRCNSMDLDELELSAALSYSSNGTVIREALTGTDDDDTLYPLSEDLSLYHKTRADVCDFLETLFPRGADEERRAVPAASLDASRTKLAAVIETLRASSAHRNELVQSIYADLAGDEPAGQVSLAVSKDEYYDRWGKHYLPSLLSAHQKQYCNSFKDAGPLKYGSKSDIFIRCRDELNAIFDGMVIEPTEAEVVDLPPEYTPRRSPTGQGAAKRTKTASTSTRSALKSTGSRYNSSANPCFAGHCRILMGDGTKKVLTALRVGDTVKTLMGTHNKVAAIMKTSVECASVRKIGDLIITPWHPILDEGVWCFPAEYRGTDAISKLYTGNIYSLLLENEALDGQHAVAIEDVVCTTLGHGILEGDGVRAHNFLGNYEEVKASIESLPKDEHGVHECGGVVRDGPGEQVVGFRNPGNETEKEAPKEQSTVPRF